MHVLGVSQRLGSLHIKSGALLFWLSPVWNFPPPFQRKGCSKLFTLILQARKTGFYMRISAVLLRASSGLLSRVKATETLPVAVILSLYFYLFIFLISVQS